mgnify:CR=1 FL=1
MDYEKKKIRRAEKDVMEGHRVSLQDRHGHVVQVSSLQQLREWVGKGFTPL